METSRQILGSIFSFFGLSSTQTLDFSIVPGDRVQFRGLRGQVVTGTVRKVRSQKALIDTYFGGVGFSQWIDLKRLTPVVA